LIKLTQTIHKLQDMQLLEMVLQSWFNTL